MTSKVVTKQAVQPDSELLKLVADLRATVNEQQNQIAGLQQGYLKIVDAMAGLTDEVIRLERNGGLNVSPILLPNLSYWRNIQERK